ncbi:hypothetical protein EMMF5_005815 [Cystobasidiomycetes sp. EMM_F5]
MITDLPLRCIQSSYEQFKKLFSNNGQRQLDTPMRLAAGGLAGMCSVVSTYPLDLVRSRISIVTASIGSAQLQAAGGGQAIPLPKEISILGMTSKVFREEGGVRGLYRGIGPTSAGVIPYVAGNFYFYGTLKDYFSAPDESLSAIGKLACGALSGAVSQGLTYPLDVLRRKMQVTGMKDKVNFKYKNSFDAIRTIVQTEGFTGLYRGIYVNMLKVAPAMGISFYAYGNIIVESIDLDASTTNILSTITATTGASINLGQATAPPSSTTSKAPPTTYLVYITVNGVQTSTYWTFTATTPTTPVPIAPATGTILAYSSYITAKPSTSTRSAASPSLPPSAARHAVWAAAALALSMLAGAFVAL